MKKTQVIEQPVKYGCEFCKREFVRERTLFSHICEYKQRWLHREQPGNRLGFQSWLQFYTKHSASKTKNKTYEEFIRNPYYSMFVKFGSYCIDVGVLNPSRYIDWLLNDNIKIDNWTSDRMYTKYLCEYLRTENAFDALERSINHCGHLAEKEHIQPNDILRYGNPNSICHAVTTGKISPWMLYCSSSGSHFLETLNEDHAKIVIDYINPEQWALKFHRDENLRKQITDTLAQAGY